MVPCAPSVFDIGPNLLAFGLQGLILAGTIYGLYRASANANVSIAQHAENLVNGTVHEALHPQGAGPTEERKVS
jgi:hypothetical protein